MLLSTGSALVAGLRQRSKIFEVGPASLPPLVTVLARAPGRGRAPAARVRVRGVRLGVRVPGPGGGCRPLCGQRPPFHSQIPQLCFGFTILLISVLHTVGTWIGLPTVPSTSSDHTRQGQTLKQTKKKKERILFPKESKASRKRFYFFHENLLRKSS